MNHETLEKMLFQIAVTTTEKDYNADSQQDDPMPLWSEEFKLEKQFKNLFDSNTIDPNRDSP